MTSAAPNAAKTIVSGSAPRRRSRRNTSMSTAHAASPVSDGRDERGGEQLPAERERPVGVPGPANATTTSAR